MGRPLRVKAAVRLLSAVSIRQASPPPVDEDLQSCLIILRLVLLPRK